VRSANRPDGGTAAKRDQSRTHGHDITAGEIRGELEKILSSTVFSMADRMTRFLRFVVEETLEGRGDNLNELLLGMAVYDRDGKFDPRVDSIVRVDAGRLRAKLMQFYASEGANSLIGIDVPKGSYKAAFKRLRGKSAATSLRHMTKEAVVTKAIAVLPFADLGPQGHDESLGEGIVEELVHALSRIPGIRVASLASVLALKSHQTDVKELGRQLGVDVFIEGSVRKVNRRLRVMVRLTDAATGLHTWSKAYVLVTRDVFATQERVSKSIAETLSVVIGAPGSVENKKTRRSR
jgi:serine/threonine-protein kinase